MQAYLTGLRLTVLCAAVSQLFAMNAHAATDAERIAELEKKLAQSMEKIDRLVSRVNELEKAASPATPPPAPASVPAVADKRIEALEKTVNQLTDAAARPATNTGLPVHGFADVGYVSSSQKVADGRKSGFVLGNVDFYLTPEFGDHVKTLIELNFEYGNEGTLGTDLERLQIGYTFSDQFTLWAGRFHTPYGYWNTAFHHGAQIQNAILRPRLIAFEDGGGILPAHTVGLWGTGSVAAGAGKLGYDVYYGNGGRTLDGTLDYNAVRDDNGNKVIGGNLRYTLSDAGLTLGVHGFSQHVGAYTGGVLSSQSKVNMFGGFGVYDNNDWEVIGEYYHFNNSDLNSAAGSRSSWAGFIQAGRTFNGTLTPFARYEKAKLNQQDPYFASLTSGRSYTRSAVGLRLDVNAKAALKFEFDRTDETRDGGQKYNEANLQYAIRF